MSGPAIFIYWHARPEEAAVAVAAVKAAQQGWRDVLAGLQANLYERHEAERERVTLMETYNRPQGFTPEDRAWLLVQAEAALARFALAGRHVEVFVPLD